MNECNGQRPPKHGLYDPALEKDSCGVGFVADIKGRPSHQIVLDADHILRRMDHRGACGCETNTGDGAGIMTGLPHAFLQKVARRDLGVDLPEPGRFAAGLVFLPTDEAQRARCKEAVERIVREQNQRSAGGRFRLIRTAPTSDRPRGGACRTSSSCSFRPETTCPATRSNASST